MGTEQRGTGENGPIRPAFTDHVHAAFDTKSGGMGVHYHAVRMLHSGVPYDSLPEWAKRSAEFFNSNYIIQPYVLSFATSRPAPVFYGPENFSPRKAENLRLLLAADQAYTQLDQKEKLKEEITSDEVKRAAVLKLGAMLAITEQITFDAKAHQRPISSDFRSDREDWQRDWREMFDGEEMPGIHELYQQAHQTLTAVSEPTDELVGYLHSLTDPWAESEK